MFFSHIPLEKLHFLKSEISEIYTSHIINLFAVSLVMVFIPIFLLNLGYTLNQVILFILVRFATGLVFAPVAGWLSNKIGFKHVILTIRLPIEILFMILLLTLEATKLNIYFISVLGGLAMIMYWIPFNSLFAKYSNKEKRGSQVAKLFSLPMLVRIIGPGLGAFLYTIFGFEVVLLVSTVVLAVSTIPLFLTPDIKPHLKFKMKRLFTLDHRDFILYSFLDGIRGMTEAYLWPIFIFLTLTNVESVGATQVLSGIGIIIFTAFIGKSCDKMSKHRILKFGALLVSFIWFARIYAHGYIDIFLLSFFGGVATVVLLIPSHSIIFNQANKEVYGEFIVMREMWLNISRVLFFAVLLLVPHKFIVAFAMAMVASFLFAFV
jgi:MFS family permease